MNNDDYRNGQGLQAAQNCSGLQAQVHWLQQQVHYGPVPTPQQQLTTRVNELRAFLAIDHESKRRLAEEELARTERALECLASLKVVGTE